jgi:hypothetical protein
MKIPYDINHEERVPSAVLSEGYVTKTFFGPALKLTTLPELLDEMILSRDSVVPEDV